MLTVLLVYPGSKESIEQLDTVDRLLPDFCDCREHRLDEGPVDRDSVIGSDLVIVFGTPEVDRRCRETVRLCKRMCTPVTLIAGESETRQEADFVLPTRDAGSLREFIVDFRGGVVKQA